LARGIQREVDRLSPEERRHLEQHVDAVAPQLKSALLQSGGRGSGTPNAA
jgi:hypothetical protein